MRDGLEWFQQRFHTPHDVSSNLAPATIFTTLLNGGFNARPTTYVQ